jgi:hypothetical protein
MFAFGWSIRGSRAHLLAMGESTRKNGNARRVAGPGGGVAATTALGQGVVLSLLGALIPPFASYFWRCTHLGCNVLLW